MYVVESAEARQRRIQEQCDKWRRQVETMTPDDAQEMLCEIVDTMSETQKHINECVKLQTRIVGHASALLLYIQKVTA